MTTVAEVKLWGRTLGAVAMEDDAPAASFQYAPEFVGAAGPAAAGSAAGRGLEVSPLVMPLSNRVYTFPHLPPSFHGLPGLVADSLPDRFGQAVIDAWLATKGIAPKTFNSVQRLCYIGTRGMGALEFHPILGGHPKKSSKLHVDQLVELASEILTHRNRLQATFSGREKEHAVRDILRVGSSAGGARAKAIIAWNPVTNEVRSGQVPAGEGFEYWLLKFDGVRNNRDRELADPQGYGAVEYAYANMARAAGITMSDCRLFEEGGRRHFMTRRFDRTSSGDKLHMQTLGALAHYDLDSPGAYAYEQALNVIRRLDLGMDAVEELFRRMAFNIVARNQDDHVKNIAFLMNPQGAWSLAPAFDITYAYNPDGAWTSAHQMTLNGKRDHFTPEDFKACAAGASMRRGRDRAVLDQVTRAVARWPRFADEAGVDPTRRDAVSDTLRLHLSP